MPYVTTGLYRALKGKQRVKLLGSATPIQRLSNIEQDFRDELGSTRLFVKRDDYMALGGGGNKLRKLEFLLGDARAAEADTIITTGGLQSNHARLTAAACAHLGLRCELILRPAIVRENDEHRLGGNAFLDRLLGAAVTRISQAADASIAMEEQAELLRTQGHRPYVIPAGGSNARGALGYAAAALELAEQEAEHDLRIRHIFLPNGGSGTHAGLAAGLLAMGGSPSIVRSFAVIGEEATAHQATMTKTAAALDLLGFSREFSSMEIIVDGGFRGSAYGAPTVPMVNAVTLMARREGLLLDPVYSGKAFAGLLALIRSERLRDAGDVVFLMTGGACTLSGYRDVFPLHAVVPPKRSPAMAEPFDRRR